MRRRSRRRGSKLTAASRCLATDSMASSASRASSRSPGSARQVMRACGRSLEPLGETGAEDLGPPRLAVPTPGLEQMVSGVDPAVDLATGAVAPGSAHGGLAEIPVGLDGQLGVAEQAVDAAVGRGVRVVLVEDGFGREAPRRSGFRRGRGPGRRGPRRLPGRARSRGGRTTAPAPGPCRRGGAWRPRPRVSRPRPGGRRATPAPGRPRSGTGQRGRCRGREWVT